MRLHGSPIPRIVLAFALLAPWAAVAGEGVEVTYLGNEGFLVAAGETRVLIDALFGDGLGGYPVVPPEPRRQAEAAEGIFAGVDLVLASHHHPDHFDPRAVARHLRANPEARFVSTEQAVERLLRVEEGLARRAAGFWPGEGERESFEHAGIRLTVLNLHHGRDRKPPVQNLGLVVELGGVRLLHVGDTEVTAADVRPYALREEGIDVALVPYWRVLDGPHGPVLEEIGARHVVAMHLPRATAPASYFGTAETLAGLEALLQGQDPGLWVPERPLAARRFR